jgi:uncharacterized protein
MQARLHVVSLGVASVPQARAFYCEGLGFRCWKAKEALVYLDAGGVLLCLCERGALDTAMGVPVSNSAGGVALSRNVRTAEEVDALMELAERAGAKAILAAHDTPWGRACVFGDPDGHVWEVAYNPRWHLDAQELLLLSPAA